MSNMNFAQLLKTFGLIAILGLATSCTRSESTSLSQVSLVLPQNGSLATTETLRHVVINVTGPGISEPRVLVWDAHGTETAPPSSLSLEVLSGENRFVQVLAVYSADSGMTFYYGEKTQTISPSVPDSDKIAVSIASIGSNILSGQAMGRFQKPDGTFPTSKVTIKYFPPNRPNAGLVVDHAAIYDGWFNFFMLDGAEFGYELEDRTLIAGKTLSLSSPEFAPSSNVLKVAIPAAYRKNFSSAGTSQWQREEPQVLAYGYFGPSAYTSGKCLARPSTLTALTELTVYTSTAPASNSTPASLPGLIESGAFPTSAELSNLTSPWSHYSVKGGAATCSTGTALVDKFDLSSLSALINGHGKDGAGIFYPPLTAQNNGSSNSPTVITPINTPYAGFHFAGEFLPGARTASGIDGMRAYKRVAATSLQNHDDGGICAEADLKSQGFVVANSNFTLSSEVFGVDLDASATDVSTGMEAVLCYTKAGQLEGNGIFVYRDWFHNGGGGGGGPANSPPIGFLKIAPALTIEAPNTCVAYTASTYELDGTTLKPQTGLTLNMMTNGASIYASSSDCSGSISPLSNVSIGSSNSSVTFFAKFQNEMFYELSGYAMGQPYKTVSFPIGISSNQTATSLSLESRSGNYNNSTRLVSGECVVLMARLKNSAGGPAKASTAYAFNMTVNATATSTIAGSFYDSLDCSGTGTNPAILSFATQTSYKMLSYKPAATLDNANPTRTDSLNVNISSPSLTSSLPIIVANSTSAGYRLFGSDGGNSNPQYDGGECIWVEPTAVNAAASEVHVAAQKTIAVTSADSMARFYTPAEFPCASAGITSLSLTMPAGSSRAAGFYVKHAPVAGNSMDVTISDGTLSTATTLNRRYPDATVQAPLLLASNLCSRLDLTLRSRSTSAIFTAGADTGPESINLNTIGSGSGTFYSDSSCSTAITNVVFSGTSATNVYFKGVSGTPGFRFTNTGDVVIRDYSFPTAINYVSAASLMSPPLASAPVGACTDIAFDIANSGSTILSNLSVPYSMTLSSNIAGLNFYLSSACNTTPASSITVQTSAGSLNRSHVWVKSASVFASPGGISAQILVNGTSVVNGSHPFAVGNPAVLTISDGPTFDFGTWSASSPTGFLDHAFIVTNTGELTATSFSQVAFGSTHFAWKGLTYPGTGGDCGTSLAGGGVCTLVVRFDPTSSGGPFLDIVQIPYSDGTGASQNVSRQMQGTGTP